VVKWLSRKIYSIISGCYSFSNTGCPIFKKIMDMIYSNNDLTTQLLNHLTMSVIESQCVEPDRYKRVDASAYFEVQGVYKLSFANCFVAEDISMEMKMSVEEAKQRSLELMFRGYH